MELKVTPIVDGHLDLAENVTLFGRDLTRSVATIRAEERSSTRQATVSLPELERGGLKAGTDRDRIRGGVGGHCRRWPVRPIRDGLRGGHRAIGRLAES